MVVGSCPSDLMMTFALYNLWTRRWLRSPSPEAQSWTMGVLEVSCCDHCWGCSAVSLSGSSEFLASSLFEVGSRSLGLMWHHKRWLWLCLYTTVLVYLSLFCRPGVPHTSGVSVSDTPPFESRVQPIKVGPWCWWT